MTIQLLIGALLIGVTVLFHALSLDLILRKIRPLEKALQNKGSFWKALLLTIVVLYVTCALIVEIWIWAIFYYYVDAFVDMEAALYFSISSFTTVGFGDIIPPHEWRLLGTIEAVNGFLLFGWSTAFIFEVVSKVYRSEAKKIEE